MEPEKSILAGESITRSARSPPHRHSEGHLFRPVNRGDQVCGDRMSEKVVWQMLKTYVVAAGLPDIAPHDLRRTTAKLCRAAGGELEQIQLLLGHSSVQTTERYLGTKQDLAHAPNDAIKLKLAG
jgi:integrase